MGVPYAEVIGDPIAYSKSPLIHKFWLRRFGAEGDYRAVRVSRDELPAYLAGRRTDPDWRGCNVTMPLKQAIIPLLDEVDHLMGSVNCVLPTSGRLIGTDTDGDGIREATARWDLSETDGTLCLIGAGGAARVFLASVDVTWNFDVRLIVRDRGKGARFMESVDARGAAFTFERADEAIEGCIGVVNASPLGMAGFPEMPGMVLDSLCGVAPGGYVLDMVTAPVETPFLLHGREAGLAVSDGLTMLVGQARRAFAHFFGLRPTSACDAELRRLLTQ